MVTRYDAQRLPNLRGEAAWNAILLDRFQAAPLTDHTGCDIAIIGAGFAGLAAARRLVQGDPTLKIVLLDALEIGEGGTGRNSGFMIDLPHDLTSKDYVGSESTKDRGLTPLNRHAIAFAGEAVEDYDIAPRFFARTGKINAAVSEQGDRANRAYADHLTQLGEPCERLDAAAMEELTGSPIYTSGLFTPGTVMLQPAGYANGMAGGLARNGVRIFPKTPVTAFEKAPTGWRVETPDGRVNCSRIILATNGHLASFGFSPRRLMQIFLFAAMSEPLDEETERRIGGQPEWGLTPADPMGTTVRRFVDCRGGARIVTRTCVDFRPGMDVPEQVMKRATHMMRKKLDDRFPQAKGLPHQFVWAGHLCLSMNGASVATEVDEGVHAACVQNGLGTTRGTLTGIAAAERILSAPSAVSEFFASAGEPSRLPPEPFTTLGARVYLRWKEWRARRE